MTDEAQTIAPPDLSKLLVVHRINPNSPLFMVAKEGFSNARYECRFFDTKEDAQNYAAEQKDATALFRVRAIPASLKDAANG